MMPPITLTLIKTINPPILSKKFSQSEEGNLIRSPGGLLIEGVAKQVEVSSLADFAELQRTLTPQNALAYGITEIPDARIITQAKLGEITASGTGATGVIARDRKHFHWSSGPGILMLDYDPPSVGIPLDQENLLAALYEACPTLRDAPHLWGSSASSCIFDGNRELRGICGQRVYVGVADARDIPRAGKVLVERLWLSGHGYFEVSKSGQLLDRCLVDGAVWQPERLDFCGGAACSPPLEQHRPEPVILKADAPPLDTATAFLDLSPTESMRLERLKKAAIEAKRGDAERAKATWVKDRVQEALERDLDADEIEQRAMYLRAVESGVLEGDFPLHTERGERVLVRELMAAPDKYDGTRFADPLEPDYRDDHRIAWLNLKSAKPYLHSHAHGGRRYTLRRELVEVRIVSGEHARAVAETLEVMRRDQGVFDRGGELVYVGDSSFHTVTAEWLRVYLGGIARFTRFDLRSASLRTIDCPLDLAKAILALRGQWDLPKVRTLIDMPLMLPDGRLIVDEGLDEASGLLMRRHDPETRYDIPELPTVEEACAALAVLWGPFAEFPFVSDVDRGVLLATLLTAVCRPGLPTSPATLFDAPAAGSGKSLLAKCVASMASNHVPSLMPSVNNDDEMRKRLLAAAREGSAIIIIDNIVGALDSPSLCSFMTSERWTDRLLGASTTVSIEVTSLLLLTGNNALLVGDLNRRVLRCRIDPKVETPWKRAFDLDPAVYVRNNRPKMITAALTLLRAFLLHGGRQTQDRTASLEAWSDLIRQAVIWAGGLGVIGLADPVLSFDEGLNLDPETKRLSALLVAWHARLGSNPATISDAITASVFMETEVDDVEVKLALHNAMNEVAGDGNLINARKLGRWIERHTGRVLGGLRFSRGGDRRGSALWIVEAQ